MIEFLIVGPRDINPAMTAADRKTMTTRRFRRAKVVDVSIVPFRRGCSAPELGNAVHRRVQTNSFMAPTLGGPLFLDGLSVGIHRRRALGRLGGFCAGIRPRSASRRRLDRAGLIDRATRPAEIVGPTARRRDRFALREGAGNGCVGGGSGAAAAEQFFRGNARVRERHDRSNFRPLGGNTLLGFWCLRGRIDRNWQRDRNAFVADVRGLRAPHSVRACARRTW